MSVRTLVPLPSQEHQHILGSAFTYEYMMIECENKQYIFRNSRLTHRTDTLMLNSKFRQLFMDKTLTVAEYEMIGACAIHEIKCDIARVQACGVKRKPINKQQVLDTIKMSMHGVVIASTHYTSLIIDSDLVLISLKIDMDEGYITDDTVFTIGDNKPSLRDIVSKFKAQGIIGLDAQLERISSIIAARNMDKSLVKQYGLTDYVEKGIILYGPPGTGKTRIAVALSKMFGSNVKCHTLVASQALGMYVGESEKAVAAPFNAAREDYKKYGDAAPIHVVIIDEIECLFPKRQNDISGSQINNRIVTEVLQALNGTDDFPNVMVIGTTNHVDRLDDAMIREGRIGTKIEVPLPNKSARAEIINYYLRESNIRSGVDVNMIAERTEGMSPSGLKFLIKQTVMRELQAHPTSPMFSTDMFISQ